MSNHLPVVPVQVTEHVYLARTCPACRRRCTPPAVLDGVVLGQQRLGVNLLSLIATLREEGRLPIRSVQWYLDTVHQLRLSVGAIVSAIHQTAQRAQPAVAAILDRIRASPVVHADETGWREDGANGYVWTFSTPTERYFLRRGRGKAVVDEALGESFSGVLVSDFYAAYHHYDGPKQRCWAHLLRDIHDQRTRYPKDAALARWAAAVHQLYVAAKACNHHEPWQRRVAQLAWERQLLAICRPFVADPSAVQGKLCRRIERHIKELFVFVAEPEVPADVGLRFPRIRFRKHLPVAGEYLGVQWVGLGLVTAGFGESAHPARVDHVHRNIGLAQPAGQQPFVAARWFTDGQGGVVLLKVFAQLGDACCGVVETQHRATRDRNVQVGLAYVNAGYHCHFLATLPVG